MKYLILFLLPLTVFATRHDVDVSKAELIERIAQVNLEVDEIDASKIKVEDKIVETQLVINTKSEERDTFSPESDEAKELQKEIDELVVNREFLSNSILYLDAKRLSKLDRKRKLGWYKRVRALPDLRLAMEEAGLQQPNMKVFVRDFIKAKDESKLISLENAAVTVQAKLDTRAAKELKLKNAKRAIKNLDPSTINNVVVRNLVIILQGR